MTCLGQWEIRRYDVNVSSCASLMAMRNVSLLDLWCKEDEKQMYALGPGPQLGIKLSQGMGEWMTVALNHWVWDGMLCSINMVIGDWYNHQCRSACFPRISGFSVASFRKYSWTDHACISAHLFCAMWDLTNCLVVALWRYPLAIWHVRSMLVTVVWAWEAGWGLMCLFPVTVPSGPKYLGVSRWRRVQGSSDVPEFFTRDWLGLQGQGRCF